MSIRTALSWAPIALLLLGTLGGSLADDLPEHAPERRGEWLVLQGDFHVHTRFSDGFMSPFDVPLVAQREGLDVVAVTEHNIVFPALLARWFSQLIGGPIVVVGSEVTTRRFHLIALGLEHAIDWDQPVADVIADIHAQDGVAIAAHPAKKYWPVYAPVMDQLDGSELMHPIALRGETPNGWRWTSMREFWLNAQAAGHDLAPIASSDYHFLRALGTMRTYVFVREATEDAVVEAIRDSRTVVYDLDGNAYGDPALVKLLADDPPPNRSKDRAYASEGALDAIARTLGWLGMVGLLIFRRRPLPRPARAALS